MRPRSDRRMNRQKGQRANAGFDRDEDKVQRLGPVDQHKPTAGRENCQRSLNPVC